MNFEKIAYYGEECIFLACKDLKKDILASCGCETEIAENSFDADIVVGNIENEKFLCEYKKTNLEIPENWEQYVVTVKNGKIIIAGSDRRGTMWGIYRVSELFGVPAGIAFTQNTIKHCESINDGTYKSKPMTYKFRGWFINDEDLLTRWHDGYTREIKDYPFYQDITNLEDIALVVETALRMNFNMIIPATLLDIADPRQEEIVAFCVKRGMFVTQHHIEPMGVSHWYYDTYMAQRGRTSEFSYSKNKDDAIEVWTYYAEKWAKYKDSVIWQLGLRGKADRPVWEKDATHGMEYWGNVISEAIAVQYGIVEKLCGKDFYSTSTLWMEGATLYHAGYLKFPQKTTLVFSDVGPTQMLSADFYDIPREKDRTYGIYYHICYWGDGGHLAQATDWRKMAYNYKLSVEAGDTEYSILNTSNVRDFILSDEANAALTKDFYGFDLDSFYETICSRYFGNVQTAEIMKEYFASFVNVPIERLDSYKQYFTFRHGEYEFNYFSASDGSIKYIGLDALDKRLPDYWVDLLTDSIEKFERLLKKAQALECDGYFDIMIRQIRHMILFSSWCRECCRYCNTGDRQYLKTAVTFLRTDLEERKELEKGMFENWYRGDKKIGIRQLIDETESLIYGDKRLNALM